MSQPLTDREIMDQALDALEEINKLSIGENAICLPAEIDTAMDALRERLAQPEQEPVLQDIEQYLMQMAGICTAAVGYWKEGDSIHPDYDTPALRDVARLYAKYDALYKAQPEQCQYPQCQCATESPCLKGLAQPEQEPGDWMVFNTGAEVASGLSYAEAVAYLTPARLERGWSASCVIDHDNPPSTSPSAPHSADSADTFCNEPDVQQIAKALRQHELTLIRTASGYDVVSLNQLDAYDK